MLRRIADLYEAHAGEFFAMCAREAGKIALDAVAELREAVDFLRYYAGEAERTVPSGAGVVVAISPWNFPLAIFTGQVAAVAGGGQCRRRQTRRADVADRLPRRAPDARGGRAPRRVAADAGRRRGGGRTGRGAGPRGRGLHRLHGDRQADRQAARADLAGRLPGGRDGRAQRHDRRLHRAPRAGGARHRRLGLPECGPALLGAARPLRAGGRGREADDHAARRRRGAPDRRPVECRRRRRPGDRRRGAGPHRRARQGQRAGAGRRGALRAADDHRHPGHRGAGRGDLRPGPACRDLQVRRDRRRHRRHQRQGLRADLRPAHPHRRPRRGDRQPDQGRQHLRQPQPDRCDRRLAAVRR